MRGGGSGSLRVVDFGPSLSWFRPGSDAVVSLAVDSPGGAVDARLELFDDGRLLAAAERRLRLAPGRSVRHFRLTVPDTDRHGYGLRVQLERHGTLTEAHSAVEALAGWWESPRHIALTDFSPGTRASVTVERLRRWHVNVAQFYDWMYRHYRYFPPRGEEVFTDALGRIVSHDVVRELIRQCRRHGIASLAYGSVYGAEGEYVARHPSELLRDAEGHGLSLDETFFITDLRARSTWRRRLIHEYVRACRRLGFDGIHMDQYGEPHEGFAADGSHVSLQELFAALIDEAAQKLGCLSPPRRVLFNCVGGWPLEHVAGSASSATYVEIWPPDVTYAAVVAQIEEARRLAPAKQIVIAAYPSVVGRASKLGIVPSADALEAAILLSSIVFAAGAFHHVLAEPDRLLVGGYYPDAVPISADAGEAMRLCWQFSARYVHLLSDIGNEAVPLDGMAIEADDRKLPLSSQPRAGTVWVRAVRTPDGRVAVQLVDLLDQGSDEWDAPRQPAVRRVNWRISWNGLNRQWHFASPWPNGGLAQRLRSNAPLRIPAFERWAMLIGEAR